MKAFILPSLPKCVLSVLEITASKVGPEKTQAATGPVPPGSARTLLVSEDTDTEPWHVRGGTEDSRCVEQLSSDLPLPRP